jgi:hypothetical protein
LPQGAVPPASDAPSSRRCPRGEQQLVQRGSGTDEMMPTLLKIRDYYTHVRSSVPVCFQHVCYRSALFPLRFATPSAFRLLDRGHGAPFLMGRPCGVVRRLGDRHDLSFAATCLRRAARISQIPVLRGGVDRTPLTACLSVRRSGFGARNTNTEPYVGWLSDRAPACFRAETCATCGKLQLDEV